MHARYQNLFKFSFIGILGVILVLSLLPIDHPDISSNDKLNHFIAYCVAMIVGWLGFVYRLKIAGVVFSWGILIEFLQGMTDYRMFSVADMVANGIGVLIGLALCSVYLHWSIRRIGDTQSSLSARQGHDH